jgi:hypothetical protein
MMKKEKGSIQCGGPSGERQRSAAYIYAIIVDGVVRYIGKGRNGRMYTHLIEAKRTSARCPHRHVGRIGGVEKLEEFDDLAGAWL